MIDNLIKQHKKQLEQYCEMIAKWSPTYNLVSRGTIDSLWETHILNCLNLATELKNKDVVITDFGSGGGLPAVILAILGYREVHAIESRAKKCSFLRQVKLAMGLDNLHIHHNRIEDIAGTYHSDIITARAFAELNLIFELSQPWQENNKKLEFALLKGQNISQEISAAKQKFSFNYKLINVIDYTGQEKESYIFRGNIID